MLSAFPSSVSWPSGRAANWNEARIPLLGVMGAFVFAAQMINFPVGVGTSGHLVGGALLACTLGAAPAVLVMTAIIAMQAFVFQDGGVLALGANVFNMAIAGVLTGYLPFKLWGAGRRRKEAIFAGAFLSVAVSASLALSELLISGIRMPQPVIFISLGLFAVSALIEGAITISVVQVLERLNPRFVQKPEAPSGRASGRVGRSGDRSGDRGISAGFFRARRNHAARPRFGTGDENGNACAVGRLYGRIFRLAMVAESCSRISRTSVDLRHLRRRRQMDGTPKERLIASRLARSMEPTSQPSACPRSAS